MGRKGRRQPHRQRGYTAPVYDDWPPYHEPEDWWTTVIGLAQDLHPVNWPPLPPVLYKCAYAALAVTLLLLLRPEGVIAAIIMLVVDAAVTSKGDYTKCWAAMQSRIQWLLSQLPSPHAAKAAGSGGSTQWQYEQDDADWQQQHQHPTGNSDSSSSSGGRCTFINIECRNGQTSFTVRLRLRNVYKLVTYFLPDGVTTDQMTEALECVVNDFNATDSPAVRKLAAPAQLQKITDLLNDHVNRIVSRDRIRAAGAGSSSSSNGQQQQQGRHRQQQQGRQPRPPSQWQQQQKDLDAAAVAVAPDVEKMSAGALKEFLKQVKVDVPRGMNQQDELLDLAKAATKLWEAQRVLRCSHIGQLHPSLELPAAMAIFKQPTHAAAAATEEEEEKRKLKKVCRQLRLALHPDKTPKQLANKQGVFVDAFKALQNAQELLPALRS